MRLPYVKLGLSVAVCTHAMIFAYPVDITVAADFPQRSIRFVAPYPPGGSNDVLARYLGIKLSDRLGQQVMIDNRGDANGIIGASLAAEAEPDGYTILIVSTSWVMNQAVRKLPYDVQKSFDPIATIGSSPKSIGVDPNWGVNDVKELVRRAKAKPASISYASTGVGGFNHFGGELFKMTPGVDLVHVPYKGGGPAMIGVMGGQIPMMFTSITQALPLARQGCLQFIAVDSKERVPLLQDIPTVAESGYPDYNVALGGVSLRPTAHSRRK